MRIPELLVPASSLEVLKTAVIFGADAVYIGGEVFSLRAKSKNFSLEDMKEGIDFAHAHGVKVYVTSNILAHNQDLDGVREYFKELKDIKPDALIISDPGVFDIAREIVPEIDVHISTQANNTNYGTYNFWYRQGARRVVTARELSMDEIADIRKHIPDDLEIETFVHGAMCISYSGRCLLSNYFTGRDANQGACTHPCRWKYAVMEESRPGEYLPVYENERGTYIFNSKDLCMIDHIPELIEAGIDSFKIEGRMKSVHYCATVAKVYRTAIDTYLKEGKDWYVRPEWIAELEKISHRPYTDGFAEGRPDETAQNYGKSTNTQSHDFIGLVMGYNEEEKYVDLEQRNNFKVGDKVEFCQPKGDLVETVIEKMTDEDGNPIDVAPHAQMKVRIYMDTPLEPYSMMRRECKLKEA